MVITLIGYRGTGKSSVAPRLAERLGWTWIDADVEYERRAGRSIRDVFATAGEAAFRRGERALLAELVQRDRLVIAAGGGAILDADTRREFREHGPVVWLQATVATIARRLAGDATTRERRPALTHLPGDAEISAILEQRTPLYTEAATITVSTEGRTVEEIVTSILRDLPTPFTSIALPAAVALPDRTTPGADADRTPLDPFKTAPPAGSGL